MADAKSLPVDLLRLDANTQNRLRINEETVEDYAEIIADSNGKWPFEPLDVFHDGIDYYVADGFHRTLGAKQAKRSSVPCKVQKGTSVDARIFGMTANDRHGMRMSRADKRACVEWLLDNQPKMTQAEVAEKSGVNPRTVRRIVADRKPSVLDKNRTLSYSSEKVADSASTSSLSSTTSTVSGSTSSISDKGKPGGRSTPSSAIPASSGPALGEAADSDLGKCPNCHGSKWIKDEFGASCAKCNHPHGEPIGDVDEGRATTQRAKWIKTIEADIRAADDMLRYSKPRDVRLIAHRDEAVRLLKIVLHIAKDWPT